MEEVLCSYLDATASHTRIVSAHLAAMLSVKSHGPRKVRYAGDFHAANPIVPVFGCCEFFVKLSHLIRDCPPDERSHRSKPVAVTECVKQSKSPGRFSSENRHWSQSLCHNQIIAVNKVFVRMGVEE